MENNIGMKQPICYINYLKSFIFIIDYCRAVHALLFHAVVSCVMDNALLPNKKG